MQEILVVNSQIAPHNQEMMTFILLGKILMLKEIGFGALRKIPISLPIILMIKINLRATTMAVNG